LVGLSRAGTQLFWRVEPLPPGVDAPAVRRTELAAMMVLIGYGLIMTLAANPMLAYTRAAAEQLRTPAQYIEAVSGTHPQHKAPSP